MVNCATNKLNHHYYNPANILSMMTFICRTYSFCNNVQKQMITSQLQHTRKFMKAIEESQRNTFPWLVCYFTILKKAGILLQKKTQFLVCFCNFIT